MQIIDPTEMRGWDSSLLQSGDDDFFHSASWAFVLKNSYGYKPEYFMNNNCGTVNFAMPFMAVSSPLTGRRGISLPFTDRCAPFYVNVSHLTEAVDLVKRYGKARGWRYVEWRDSDFLKEGIAASEIFFTHDLDLDRPLSELYRNFDDSNRRNIQKAKRENVLIKIGRSPDALESFFKLHCLTRKRHGMPPQPRSFFKNLLEHVIARDLGFIVLASHAGKDIAASVFLHFGRRAVFKFGASNPEYLHKRPNNLVIWEAVQCLREKGFLTLSLGRTEINNPGLLRFKRAWAGKEIQLKYTRFDLKKSAYVPAQHAVTGVSKAFFSKTPLPILRLIGRFAYKHMG